MILRRLVQCALMRNAASFTRISSNSVLHIQRLVNHRAAMDAFYLDGSVTEEERRARYTAIISWSEYVSTSVDE